MNGHAPGKVRHPGLVLLLFVVTIGIYWFVWLHRAFSEVARTRGREIHAGFWVAVMVPIWAVALALSGAHEVQERREDLEEKERTGVMPQPSLAEILNPEITPLVVAGMVAWSVLYLVQIMYLKSANTVVNEILASAGLAPGPAPALALAFNVLSIVGQVPLIGIVAGLGGLVIAIIWVIQLQGAINRYWQPRGYGQPPPPPQAGSPVTGWTPAPPPPPPAIPPPRR